MRSLLLFAFLVFTFISFSQKMKQPRMKNFDKKAFSFGFTLGINSSDFTVFQLEDAYESYGLVSITNKSQPGGQLGILTSLKLGTPVLRLRLMPTLSFQERVLEYRSLDSSNFKNGISEERINSTCLNIPLTFIFKTKRLFSRSGCFSACGIIFECYFTAKATYGGSHLSCKVTFHGNSGVGKSHFIIQQIRHQVTTQWFSWHIYGGGFRFIRHLF